MKIDIDGKQYDYIEEDLTLEEAFDLKALTGWGIGAFYHALAQGEPDALAWVAYITRKRAGEKDVQFKSSVVNVLALITSLNVEDAEDGEPDPTQPETD